MDVNNNDYNLEINTEENLMTKNDEDERSAVSPALLDESLNKEHQEAIIGSFGNRDVPFLIAKKKSASIGSTNPYAEMTPTQEEIERKDSMQLADMINTMIMDLSLMQSF